MSSLKDQLQYAVDTKNLIKEAIKSKGVDVPDRTVFREYPEKINEILNEFTPQFPATPQGALLSPVIKEAVVFPTEVDGQAMSTTFTYQGTHETFWGVRRLVWPEYFLDVNLNQVITPTSQYGLTEALDISATALTGDNLNYMRHLNSISLRKYAGGLGWKLLNQSPISTQLKMDIPEVDLIDFFDAGTDAHLINLTLNAPSVKYVGYEGTSGVGTLQHCTGTWTFPALTDLRNIPRPNGEQTMYLPSIETQRWPQSFSTGGNGMLHLYLGPNLSRVEAAPNWISHAANIDVHIPAGDSTTKSTLDAAGIPYTQDYDL